MKQLLLPILLIVLVVLSLDSLAQRPFKYRPQQVKVQAAGRVDTLSDFIQLTPSSELLTGGKVLEVYYKKEPHLSLNGKKYRRADVFAYQTTKGYFRKFTYQKRGKTRYYRTHFQRIDKEGGVHEYKNIRADIRANDLTGRSLLLHYTYFRWYHFTDQDKFVSNRSVKDLKEIMSDCPACVKKVRGFVIDFDRIHKGIELYRKK